jgi:hypothetical protein
LASTFVGTQKKHLFYPLITSTLKVKRFSGLDTFQIKKICNFEQLLHEEHINGYPGYETVVYDEAWWLWYVIKKNTEQTVKVNFTQGTFPILKIS